MNFSEFKFVDELNETIASSQFVECTPIQAVTIGPILEGKDIAGLAQTGTGKTAAFLLPLMDRVLRSKTPSEQINEETKAIYEARSFSEWKENQFVLVLVPTRELAQQVYQNFMQFKGRGNLRAAFVYGGTSYEQQRQVLHQGVDFVIGTPGRLIDLYKEHLIDFRQVRAIVFDEADRMFDMGFKDDMKYVLNRVPKTRQFLVFSATLNFDVLNIAYQYGAHPIECDVSRDQATSENVEDIVYHVGFDEKPKFLLSLVKKQNPQQAIVFSNSKFNVGSIAGFLTKNGVPAMGISSLLTQAQRNRVMQHFREKKDVNILVATDVAARGLDIKGVDLVINYDLPDDPENYVHRIGRTGRAGEKGHALSLASDRDVEALTRIEEYLKRKVTIGWLEENEIITDFQAFEKVYESEKSNDRGNRDNRRPNGDRGPRHRDRTEQRPQQQQQRRPDFKSEGRPDHKHRDRRLGRHSGDERNGENRMQKRAGPEGQRQHQGQKQQHMNGKRDRKQFQTRDSGFKPHHRRPLPKTKGADKSGAGIGQKVTAFFKRLFGA